MPFSVKTGAMPDIVSTPSGMKKKAIEMPCTSIWIIRGVKSAWVLNCERITLKH